MTLSEIEFMSNNHTSTMIPRDRVLAALEHRQPDRIPYHVEFTREAHCKLAEVFGDREFDRHIGNHLATTKTLAAGFPREIQPGFFEDEFGVIWDRTHDRSLGIPRPVLPEPTLDGYRFPDPLEPERYRHLDGFIDENETLFRVIKVSHALFERAWSLRGFQQFMTDMLLYPDFAEELLTRITDFNLTILDQLQGRCIDGIWFGDDWAQQQGLLMSHELWRRMLKPHLQRMFQKVRAQGWTVMIHCCGAIEPLLPDLIEMGVQVFNPFQPEVMDIYRLKREYGKFLTFFGGLSIQQLLPFGTPEQVRQETRRLITEIGAGGGFILSPAHALPADIPVQNIQAMIIESKQ